MTAASVDITPPRLYPYGVRHDDAMVADLSRAAWEFRIKVLTMVYNKGTGHIGGAFSISEFLTALFFHHLRLDPANPEWEGRDRLIFSKGHACAMLYTCMAYRGFFPPDELDTFRDLDSRLQGHPERQKLPGIEVPAGPLGHGIAIATGMCLAAKIDGRNSRSYVILGDGELGAGVIWEGAMAAAQYKLDNLVAVLDYNGVQQTGSTDQVLNTEPIADKWRSFGWHVIDIHGHNMRSILDALDLADEIHHKPTIIIGRGTKGKGVSFMEYNPYWHGSPPKPDEYAAALAELQKGAAQWAD
jgi:transketolase